MVSASCDWQPLGAGRQSMMSPLAFRRSARNHREDLSDSFARIAGVRWHVMGWA